MLWQHYLNPSPPSSLTHLRASPQHSPEPLGLVVEGAWISTVGGLVELWQESLAGLLAGVVGELDRDGLGGTRWLLSVQALDGLLSLYPLIKADEAHTSGATCGASRSQTNTGPFYFTGFRGNCYDQYVHSMRSVDFCPFPLQQNRMSYSQVVFLLLLITWTIN